MFPVGILIDLLILVVVFGVVFWILTLIPLPPPWGTVAQVVLGLIFFLIIVNMLFGLAGGSLGYSHPLPH